MGIVVSKGSVSTVTFSAPQEIIISHTDDSIRIGDGTDLVAVNPDGSINTKHVGPATSSVTSVTVTTSSTTVLAANPTRKGLMIYNDTASRVYIKLGASATVTSFTIDMPANSYYDAPSPCYTGIVTAVKTSGTATLRVTEITD